MNGEGDLGNTLTSEDPSPAEGKTEHDGHFSEVAIARREELRRRGLVASPEGEDMHPYHPSRKSAPIDPSTGTLRVVPDSLLKRQIKSDS